MNIDDLARETEGFSGADIASVCSESKLIAIRNFVVKHDKDLEQGDLDVEKCECKITQAILLEALEQTKPSEERAVAIGKDMRKETSKEDMGFI